jgi:glycosyltransferase involved in cell wall biosynthesis
MSAVSVVIPLYQTERYIAVAVESVLAQTFRNFEVIVVDDGSTDRGPDVVRGFNDPRIRLVSQENRGLAGARNTGIREASAPLIAFLDADDVWHPEKLARHVAHFAASPGVGLSFSWSRLINAEGRTIGAITWPVDKPVTPDVLFCHNPVGNGSSPVVRRQALDGVSFVDSLTNRAFWFDETFRQSEDIECWMRIALLTPWTFGVVPETLTDYRVLASGLSANVDRQIATWRRFRDRVAEHAPDLVARAGARAEAHQLRYLARRAVTSADRGLALRLMSDALRLHPALLIEAPRLATETLAAAIVARCLSAERYTAITQRYRAVS